MEVADEVVVMNQGRIEQVGTPAEIYDHPATPFVMSFVGEVNVLPSNPDTARLFRDRFCTEASLEVNPALTQIFVRPHELELETIDNGSSTQAVVKRIIHLGREIQAELILSDNLVVVAHLSREQFAQLNLQAGQPVFVKPKNVKFFQNALSLSA